MTPGFGLPHQATTIAELLNVDLVWRALNICRKFSSGSQDSSSLVPTSRSGCRRALEIALSQRSRRAASDFGGALRSARLDHRGDVDLGRSHRGELPGHCATRQMKSDSRARQPFNADTVATPWRPRARRAGRALSSAGVAERSAGASDGVSSPTFSSPTVRQWRADCAGCVPQQGFNAWTRPRPRGSCAFEYLRRIRVLCARYRGADNQAE
jgi:hypothetical protein